MSADIKENLCRSCGKYVNAPDHACKSADEKLSNNITNIDAKLRQALALLSDARWGLSGIEYNITSDLTKGRVLEAEAITWGLAAWAARHQPNVDEDLIKYFQRREKECRDEYAAFRAGKGEK